MMVWLINHQPFTMHSKIEARKFNFIGNDQLSIFFDSLIDLRNAIRKGNFKADRGRVITYWKQIHYRHCQKWTSMHGREHSVDISELELPDDAGKVNEVESKQDFEVFRKAYPNCAKILAMHTAGYSMKDIAESAGLANAGTARVTKSRCLKKLKKFLENESARHEHKIFR